MKINKRIIKINICFLVIIIIIFAIIYYQSSLWKKKFGISNAYIEKIGDYYSRYYIKGNIQNKIDKDVTLTIEFELKSGTIKQTESCSMSLDNNETKEIDCLISSDKNIDETYAVTVKNITWTEFDY